MLQFVSTIPFGELVSAGLGAFGGAWAAYQFGKRKAQDDQKEQRYSALVDALMTLNFSLNSLENLRRRWDKWRGLPDRELKIRYFKMVANKTKLKFESLAFIVPRGGGQILMDVYIAESLYRNAFDAVDTRNAFLREIQNSRKSVLRPDGSTEVEVDPVAVKLLADSTESVYQAIDRAAEHIPLAAKNLRALGLKLFPGMGGLPRGIIQQEE